MKKIKFYLLIPQLIIVLLFSSCENFDEDLNIEKESVTESGNSTEKIVLLSDENSEILFNSYEELLEYLEGSEGFNEIKSKIESFQNEIIKINKLKLWEESENSEIVTSYIADLNKKEPLKEDVTLKTAILNFMFFDYNLQGKCIYAFLSNPAMSSANRNQVSSVQATTGMFLCSKTWFRGTKYFVWGKKDLPSTMNDNTESYYGL